MKDPLHNHQFSKNNNNLHSCACKLVHTMSKYWIAASIKKLPEQWQWCIALGSKLSVLNCNYVVVIISQPVFQASPNRF
jgi:hypothetical protein